MDRRERDDNEERSSDALGGEEMVEQHNALNSLAEAHLIRENRVRVVVPRVKKPIRAPRQ